MRAIHNYLIFVGLLLLVGSSCANPPTVTGIVPSAGVNSGTVSITDLAGADFLSGAGVMLTPVNADPVHKVSITDGGGSIPFLNSPISVYVSGPYVYVASYGSNTLEIVDVIDPGAPVHAGSIQDGDGGASLQNPFSVSVSGNYAYVTSSLGNQLEIVDVTDRSNPFHVSSIGDGDGGALLDYPEGVFVSGNYAYVASAGSNALEIVDITAPEVPFHAGSISDGDGGALLSQPESVYVSGNFAYVTIFGSNALEIVDVTDPTAPVHAGSISDGDGGALLNQPGSVYVAGKYAYVTSGGSNALEIVDITDPTAPVHAGSISDGDGGALLSGPMSVSISGNYAYVASLSNALEVVDVSNPSSPVHAGSISDSEGAALLKMPYSVFISGNYAYIASFYDNALEIVDIRTITGTSVNVGSAEHILCTFDLAGKSPGAYNVVVTNPDGQSGTLGSGFTVTEPVTAPVAAFSGTPTTGSSPLTVAFTDASTGDPTGWAWYFGDEDYKDPWTEMNASFRWPDGPGRSGHSSVALPDGTILLMGGGMPNQNGLNDTRESTDNGATWTLLNFNSEWLGRRGHASVVLPDSSIVLMGGKDSSTFFNDTWRSTNKGRTWIRMNVSSGWPGRWGHTSVVLPDGSIVLMGGRISGSPGYENDVWRSTDNGATWTQVNASGGWSARWSQSSVVMADGSIVMMGGSASDGVKNDVWQSTDKGATWTLVNASAGWTARYGHTCVVLPDGSIVLMGGVDNNNGCRNDTWRSMDKGATWTQLPDAGWSERSFHSSVAMPEGSIVLTGGNDEYNDIVMNDVWRFIPIGSSDPNPPHTYTRPGTYNVTLQAYNNGGFNSMQKARYITVTQGPAFIAIDPVGDKHVGDKFTITAVTNISVGKPVFVEVVNATVLPDFSISTGTVTVQSGTGFLNQTQFDVDASTFQPGLYRVNETSAEYGVTNGTFFTVLEGGSVAPVADFIGAPTTGTAPLSVQFNDTSYAMSPQMWNWSFGDSASSWFNTTDSEARNASFTYTAAGTYTVSLTITNASGSNTATQPEYIKVNEPSRVAAFSGTPTTGPSPLIVAFTDASTGDPTSWSWDFGDGDSTNSTVQNPVHTYTNVGSYTVTLTAGNAAGSDDETKEDYITVIPPSPVAAFSGIPTTGDAPLAVTFTDESTGDPTGHVWYFGDEDFTEPWVLVNPEPEWSAREDASSVVMPDGDIVLMGGVDSSGTNLNDVWRSADKGATWNLVNANAGWSERSGHSSVVLPDWSIVLMGGWGMNDVWRSTDKGATWILMNASAGWKPRRDQSCVVLPDGTIVVMGGYSPDDNRDLNDVWRSTDKGATWTLVSDSAEWEARERHSSVVLPDGSIVVLCGVSKLDQSGMWIYADAWRSTDMGKTWIPLPADFPVGRYDHNSVVMPDGSVVTFSGRSEYPTNIVNRFRTDENTWSQVNWSIPIPLFGQTSVVLHDGSIIVMGGRDVVHSWITKNIWKFQPGGSTDQNPSHTYAEPGIFNVTLQVSSESGFNTLRKAEYISVSEPVIPVAAFSGDPTNGIVPLTVIFTDKSINSPTSWSWDFGDGNNTNSTLQNPVHTYTNAGIFTVTLTAGNAAGSDDEVRMDYIEVKAEPFAAFTATPVTGTVPLTVTFKDDSTGDITSWFWDFGDGGSSSDQNPVHTYESTGTYSVLLTVNWDDGWDEESRIEYITVNPPPPVAAFSGAPREGAAPLMVAFTDASSGEITGSAWFFGDETYSAAWTERTASAGWWGRSSHTSVVMPDGSIVLMGGDGGDLMDDVWRSTNGGYTWTEIIGSDRWTGRAHHSSVTLADNRIVLMGGYDGISRKNDTWQSTDYGATWTRMTESAGWTERSSHQSVVMPDGSIILTGGGDNTGTGIWNDAWRSTDHGATWTRMTADAEWAARYQHSSVALPDGSILVMGGLDSSGNKLNDVWRSTDNGGTWTQLQDAPWSARFGHSCIVMPDGSIVLTGGRDAGGYRNDVWRSKDKGVTWTQLPDAGWTARNEHSNVVMPDGSIVLIGGMTDISPYYMGDVWRLQPAGSVTKHPYYTYTEPGIYNVTLQVYNGGGFDSVRMDEYINVTVPVAPVADFEGDPLTGTVPLTVFFTSQVSTGIGPFTYSWDFNNDGTEDSIEQDPIYTYESAGTYTVRLMVTNDVGTDEEIKTDYITVDPTAPIAAFAGNPLSGTVPLTVVFTDLSMRDPASWSWEFGDGDISTEQHPAHTYDSAGTFTVTLTVTNTVDSSVEIKTDYITVIPTPPVAAFTGTPTTGKAPLTVAFTDDSTGGESAGWAWFFGDEDFSESWTQQTADAEWNLHGHCSVAMPDRNIILMGFREDSLGFEVWRSVNNGATWARRSSTDGLTLQYQTSVALPDGKIVMMGGFVAPVTTNDVYMSSDNGATWWNFGSGEWTARAKHSSVVMPDGSIVLMGGEDIVGGEHVSYMNDVWRSMDNGKTWLIQTTSPGWTARSSHSSVAMPDGSIVLMGGIDDGGPQNDVWRSTDNGATWTEVTESAGWTARYGHSSVAMPDGSIILMGGVDADDIQDDVWRSIDYGVTWTQLTGTTWPARFTPSSVAMPDGSIVLIGGKDGDGNALNDVWRFMPVGSPAENPSHSYTVPGIYNVTLQVYNAGGFDSTRKIEYISVTEQAIAPVAAFSATPTAGTAPLTVQFVDMSENDPTSWSWDFGDGDSTNSTQQNPVHTYAVTGIYTVTLTTANSAGSDDEIKEDYITVGMAIPLSPGWNFVSTPRVLKAGSDTAGAVFGGVDTDGHSVFQYDAATKTWEAMTASSKVKVLDGIWIYSKTATAVSLEPDPNPLIVPPVKPLAAEWNAVGFSDTEPATARDTFASVRVKWSTAIGFDSLKQRYETSYINGGTGIHSDYNLMNPPKGYWLYMTEPGTLAAIGA